MKMEIKRLNQDLTEFSNNMPAVDLNKIYYKKSYDSIKTLWIDKDIEAFKRKEKKMIKFLERIDIQKRGSYIFEQVNAYNQVLYDMECLIRSSTLVYIGSMVADAWYFQRVNYYMDLYDKTGDKKYYGTGKKLLTDIKNVHDKLSTQESIEKMKRYVENLESNDDLTNDDKEILNALTEYIEEYPFSHNIQKKKGSNY